MLRTLGLALSAFLCVQTAAAAPFVIRGVERIVTGPTFVDVFRRPMGLAIDPSHGILAIGDTGNNRVVLFDSLGRSRGSIHFSTALGAGAGEPKCVAIDRRGRLFVLDAMAATIEVISASGSRLGWLQPQLPAAIVDARAQPQFVAAGPSGRLYVLYSGERAGLVIVEPNGQTSRSIGFGPPESAVLQGPLALAVDSSETRIVVLDPPAPNQIKIFAPDGTLIQSFGEHGEGEGTYSLAAYAAWGPNGTLWVLDTIRHSISIHAADGAYLARIGGYGRDPGALNYPAACGFLSAQRFVVLERGGSRFQIFELEPASLETLGLGSRFENSDSGNTGVDELVSGGR
jgi:DNA-binding beta-propeller fold protein YncE